MGLVEDITYKENNYKSNEDILPPVSVVTSWQPAKQSFEPQNMTLQLHDLTRLDNTKTMLVGIGIEMGTPISNQVITSVKYAGAAKILTTG